MSIRRPDLGPGGRAELDEPLTPPGLGPADRAALSGDKRWPVSTPPVEQPTAGGIRQPLGTEDRNRDPMDPPPAPDGYRPGAKRDPEEHVIGDPEREDDRVEEEDQGFAKE